MREAETMAASQPEAPQQETEPSGEQAAALEALTALLAASPVPQALFDSEGAYVAASPEFTRNATAEIDATGRLRADFITAADRRTVTLLGRAYQLLTLRDPPRPRLGELGADGKSGAGSGNPPSGSALVLAALDAIPAAISIKDRAGRYLFMNVYQARHWGVDPAAAIGRTASEVLGVPDTTQGMIEDQKVIETGEAVPFFEERHKDAMGRVRDWLVTKLPLSDPVHGTAGVITFALDISDRKRLEEVLIETKRIAEAASQAKTLFLAQVSHELRTPLNAIIGFTEMMTQKIFGPLGAPQYEGYVSDVLKAARHLLGIITDMLDVTRLDAGALALELGPVTPGDVVAEAGRMVALPASTKRIVLQQSVEPGLPVLIADARRLRQALINLVANAVKFTPEGGTVSIGARRASGMGSQEPALQGVEIYVEDSGIGMTPDEIRTALHVFGRVREGYAKAQDGTGIGLPLAKALIERHGGRFVIESEPGRGTRIRAIFPAACLAPAEVSATAAASAA